MNPASTEEHINSQTHGQFTTLLIGRRLCNMHLKTLRALDCGAALLTHNTQPEGADNLV
jgi:hypothetical protein